MYRTNRMIFLALLESAMRYREATWREDVEYFKSSYEQGRVHFIEASTAEVRKKKKDYFPDKVTTKRWNKIFDSNRDRDVSNFEKKIKSFNDRMYREVSDTFTQLSEKGQKDFDNYAAGTGMILEEYMKTKNTTHIVTLCKVYNEGGFDDLMNSLKVKEKDVPAT